MIEGFPHISLEKRIMLGGGTVGMCKGRLPSYYCPHGPTMVMVGGQPFVRSGLYLLFGQGGPTYTLILIMDERWWMIVNLHPLPITILCYSRVHFQNTTPFMVFSLTYTICEGPRLDVCRSRSVTPINCQYDSIRQHK